MSNLQDEETPITEKQNTDSDNMSAESSWNAFEQTHPSIIDKLFSGKLVLGWFTYIRYVKDDSNLRKMHQEIYHIQSIYDFKFSFRHYSR